MVTSYHETLKAEGDFHCVQLTSTGDKSLARSPAAQSELVCGRRSRAGNKTLLAEPRQESVWGLVAWPKPSQEQAPWWEEEYFSLPPLTGPCLCECSLRTKVMLHPQPTPASCFIPPTFPALASKKEPTSVEDQPQREPRSACHTKAPKAGPKLPPKAKFQSCPKAGKASQALRPLAPMAIWPQVLIKNPAKSSPLKGRHAPAAKEAASSLGTSDNPLPHLSSK
ncbi:hypothetical protein TREES_T100014830 [Tupaia chinensis]|uniref:Uncharacterized protein n=1 Tax=Tupaia chinensis TaxID=246437 RepID=L9KTE2_TUPCH|nr:hypothetical protein TREES_T100014830 [Tupaia chinensis]